MKQNQIFHFLLLKEMKEKIQIQQSKWIVKNVVMMKLYGGCSKLEVLMNLPQDFIAVRNVNTPGDITHNV